MSNTKELAQRVHQVIVDLTLILTELDTLPDIEDAQLGLAACRHLEHELESEVDRA